MRPCLLGTPLQSHVAALTARAGCLPSAVLGVFVHRVGASCRDDAGISRSGVCGRENVLVWLNDPPFSGFLFFMAAFAGRARILHPVSFAPWASVEYCRMSHQMRPVTETLFRNNFTVPTVALFSIAPRFCATVPRLWRKICSSR